MFAKQCLERLQKSPQVEVTNKMETKLSTTFRIDTKSLKIDPKSMKNPWKSIPNRVRIETKNVKKSRESLQDDLGGARGAIFRLGSQHEAPSWTPKFTKIHEKIV